MLPWGHTHACCLLLRAHNLSLPMETSIRQTPNETLHKTSDQYSSKLAEAREIWLPRQQETKETQILNLLQHPEWERSTKSRQLEQVNCQLIQEGEPAVHTSPWAGEPGLAV